MSATVLTLVETGGTDAGDDAGAAGAEDLRRLMHKAILARRFAAVHRQTASRCLRSARVAARHGDGEVAASLLRDAREEHAEMQTCRRVARALERQAEELGQAAGVYRATGRAGTASAANDAMPAIAGQGTAGSASVPTAASPATRRTRGGSE